MESCCKTWPFVGCAYRFFYGRLVHGTLFLHYLNIPRLFFSLSSNGTLEESLTTFIMLTTLVVPPFHRFSFSFSGKRDLVRVPYDGHEAVCSYDTRAVASDPPR